MPAYAAAIPRPPRTLTEFEQATLLRITPAFSLSGTKGARHAG